MGIITLKKQAQGVVLLFLLCSHFLMGTQAKKMAGTAVFALVGARAIVSRHEGARAASQTEDCSEGGGMEDGEKWPGTPSHFRALEILFSA